MGQGQEGEEDVVLVRSVESQLEDAGAGGGHDVLDYSQVSELIRLLECLLRVITSLLWVLILGSS